MHAPRRAPVAANSATRWQIDDLPWSQLDVGAIRANEELFYLIVSASFIESGSELYTRNLIDYYGRDAEVQTWLRGQWESEELLHGRALRTYVQRVWPEFDWAGAFERFFAEYAQACSPQALEPTPLRELAARCVVETGTSAYYRALSDAAPEPVLRRLAALIAADEINHYKHFLGYFLRYQKQSRSGRWAVLLAIWRRALEARQDDADCAIRHTWAGRHPDRPGDRSGVRDIGQRMSRKLRQHLPAGLLVRMLLQPLRLHHLLRKGLEAPLTLLLTRVLLQA